MVATHCNLYQVISGQLVSFRSIAELQEQNQKLLCVVRELSEEQERREMEDEDPKVGDLPNTFVCTNNIVLVYYPYSDTSWLSRGYNPDKLVSDCRVAC